MGQCGFHQGMHSFGLHCNLCGCSIRKGSVWLQFLSGVCKVSVYVRALCGVGLHKGSVWFRSLLESVWFWSLLGSVFFLGVCVCSCHLFVSGRFAMKLNTRGK